MKTRVTELLGIEYPIIQGGMAWVADHHIAAAVSEAGGLGLIAAANAPAEWVREQIREAKKLTDKPFGVNIMLMSTHQHDVYTERLICQFFCFADLLTYPFCRCVCCRDQSQASCFGYCCRNVMVCHPGHTTLNDWIFDTK